MNRPTLELADIIRAAGNSFSAPYFRFSALGSESAAPSAPALCHSGGRTVARSPTLASSALPFFLPVMLSAASSVASSWPETRLPQAGTRLPWVASPLAEEKAFRAFLRSLFCQDWMVYAKPPFGGPPHVLQYLARYTHQAAISNHRLVASQTIRSSFVGRTAGSAVRSWVSEYMMWR
jgi:Putative transposase